MTEAAEGSQHCDKALGLSPKLAQARTSHTSFTYFPYFPAAKHLQLVNVHDMASASTMTDPELSDADLQDVLQFTISLALEAGEEIERGSSAVSTVDEKKNAVDLVTQWDKAVEALVRDRIAAKYGFQFKLCVSRGRLPSLLYYH